MNGTDPDAECRWREALRWFAKAEEDIRAASLMKSAAPPLLDPAAYHCQQATEKILKGALAARGTTIPRTHDLEHLAALAHPTLSGSVSGLLALTSWATATRYPELEADIGLTMADIEQALTDIRRLLLAANALGPA